MKSVKTMELPNTERESSDKGKKVLSSLERSLQSLDKISRHLSSISSVVLISTSCNLIVSIITFFISASIRTDSSSSVRDSDKFPVYSFVVLGWLMFLAIMAMLYYHEQNRRRGDVLFEEISDELEWHITDNNTANTPSSRPKIDARVALRSFVKTTALPFISGKNGSAFYLVLNLIFSLFSSYSLLRIS